MRILMAHGAVFAGLMLVMAVYNMFFFISSREPGYLYLSCFIIAYALFEFSFKGLASQYFWPDGRQETTEAISFDFTCSRC